ncbi:MAG: RidA family protein [Erysipelothrix sp.]|nr:RidA family protein [Erysipelothrix sp.]
MRKSVNSLQVPKPSGSYSQVLKVGDFVYISGQIGLNKDMLLPQTIDQQVENIFTNITALLGELKMHINQITRVSIYAKNGQDIKEIDALYQGYFKHPFPARTFVFVDSLSHDDALIEIAFDAIDLSAYEAMQGCSGGGCNGCEDDDCEHSGN